MLELQEQLLFLVGGAENFQTVTRAGYMLSK